MTICVAMLRLPIALRKECESADLVPIFVSAEIFLVVRLTSPTVYSAWHDGQALASSMSHAWTEND